MHSDLELLQYIVPAVVCSGSSYHRGCSKDIKQQLLYDQINKLLQFLSFLKKGKRRIINAPNCIMIKILFFCFECLAHAVFILMNVIFVDQHIFVKMLQQFINFLKLRHFVLSLFHHDVVC